MRRKKQIRKQRVERRGGGNKDGVKTKSHSTKWFLLTDAGREWYDWVHGNIKKGELKCNFTTLLLGLVFMCDCAVVAWRLAIPPSK